MSDDMHQLVKTEAARAGIGMNAYIREAAISRAIVSMARRGHYAESEPLNQAVRSFLAAEARNS